MPTDHTLIRQLIDQSLAGVSLDPHAQQALRDHLSACAACSQYLESSNRAIAALGDFSFAVDPALDSKVHAALAARAQQLQAADVRHQRRWHIGLLAVALTVIGSLAVSQLGALATARFHVQPAQLQFGLATFWITPSVFFCLLLLLLPAFDSRFGNKKGLSL